MRKTVRHELGLQNLPPLTPTEQAQLQALAQQPDKAIYSETLSAVGTIATTMATNLQALQPELSALCRRYRVRRLDVFGSAVTGKAHADSDIDLLVEFEPMSEGYADAYFGLLDALQTLLRKPVDLVVESAIRNPYFRQSVQASRAPLYAA